jgi:hypothetical protein
MQVETHDKLGSPKVIQCSRLLVRDTVHGNPVCVVLEHSPGQFYAAFADDDPVEFNRALKLLGVDEIVICDTLDTSKLDRPPGEILLPPGV